MTAALEPPAPKILHSEDDATRAGLNRNEYHRQRELVDTKKNRPAVEAAAQLKKAKEAEAQAARLLAESQALDDEYLGLVERCRETRKRLATMKVRLGRFQEFVQVCDKAICDELGSNQIEDIVIVRNMTHLASIRDLIPILEKQIPAAEAALPVQIEELRAFCSKHGGELPTDL